MRALVIFILLTVSCSAYSQYYYNDIITTNQTNQQYKLLKENKIQQVTAKSYEADGSFTEDFILNQQISSNASTITTTSEYPSSGTSISVSQYQNNRISKTTDSADKVKSTTTYTYDNNNLAVIQTVTEDAFMNNSSVEIHQWIYENNLPVKMLLLKDNGDTTIIHFIKDTQDNITGERWLKKGRTVENYFYYYNEKNYLTDIVRFNARAQRLLPDYLFDYDENGRLIQFKQVPQSSDDYLIWQYVYNPNGLKQKELLFNKLKQPVGRIEYSYR